MTAPTEQEQQMIDAMRADNEIWTKRRAQVENVTGVTNLTVKDDMHAAGNTEHNVYEPWKVRKARKAAENAAAAKAVDKAAGIRGSWKPQDVTTNEIMERATAKERGSKRYFTGRRCSHGHLAERYVKSGLCVVCHRSQVKRKAAA